MANARRAVLPMQHHQISLDSNFDSKVKLSLITSIFHLVTLYCRIVPVAEHERPPYSYCIMGSMKCLSSARFVGQSHFN